MELRDECENVRNSKKPSKDKSKFDKIKNKEKSYSTSDSEHPKINSPSSSTRPSEWNEDGKSTNNPHLDSYIANTGTHDKSLKAYRKSEKLKSKKRSRALSTTDDALNDPENNSKSTKKSKKNEESKINSLDSPNILENRSQSKRQDFDPTKVLLNLNNPPIIQHKNIPNKDEFEIGKNEGNSENCYMIKDKEIILPKISHEDNEKNKESPRYYSGFEGKRNDRKKKDLKKKTENHKKLKALNQSNKSNEDDFENYRDSHKKNKSKKEKESRSKQKSKGDEKNINKSSKINKNDETYKDSQLNSQTELNNETNLVQSKNKQIEKSLNAYISSSEGDEIISIKGDLEQFDETKNNMENLKNSSNELNKDGHTFEERSKSDRNKSKKDKYRDDNYNKSKKDKYRDDDYNKSKKDKYNDENHRYERVDDQKKSRFKKDRTRKRKSKKDESLYESENVSENSCEKDLEEKNKLENILNTIKDASISHSTETSIEISIEIDDRDTEKEVNNTTNEISNGELNSKTSCSNNKEIVEFPNNISNKNTGGNDDSINLENSLRDDSSVEILSKSNSNLNPKLNESSSNSIPGSKSGDSMCNKKKLIEIESNAKKTDFTYDENLNNLDVEGCSYIEIGDGLEGYMDWQKSLALFKDGRYVYIDDVKELVEEVHKRRRLYVTKRDIIEKYDLSDAEYSDEDLEYGEPSGKVPVLNGQITVEESKALKKYLDEYAANNGLTWKQLKLKCSSNLIKKKDGKFWRDLCEILPYRTKKTIFANVAEVFHFHRKKKTSSWTKREEISFVSALKELLINTGGHFTIGELAKKIKKTPLVTRTHLYSLYYLLRIDERPMTDIEIEKMIHYVKSVHGQGEWPPFKKKINWGNVATNLKFQKPVIVIKKAYESRHPDNSLYSVPKTWTELDDKILLTKVMKLKRTHEEDVSWSSLSKNFQAKIHWKKLVRTHVRENSEKMNFPKIQLELARKMGMTKEKRLEIEKLSEYENW